MKKLDTKTAWLLGGGTVLAAALVWLSRGIKFPRTLGDLATRQDKVLITAAGAKAAGLTMSDTVTHVEISITSDNFDTVAGPVSGIIGKDQRLTKIDGQELRVNRKAIIQVKKPNGETFNSLDGVVT